MVIPPHDLAPPIARQAQDVRIATGADGTTVAAWKREIPGGDGPRVEAAVRPNGGAWSMSTVLESVDAPEKLDDVQATVTPTGVVAVI
ncbi:MAG: hypothetical protein AB7G37_11295 [Solirubrobacteraceae bacterium]